MKILLALAFTVVSAAAFCAPVNINGDFSQITKDGKGLNGWFVNGAFKPVAVIGIEKGAKETLVSLDRTGAGMTHIFRAPAIPAKNGEKFKLSITVKGSGNLTFGLYAYGTKAGRPNVNIGGGGTVPDQKLEADFKTFTAELAVKDASGGILTGIRPFFGVTKGSKAVFKNISIEKIEAAK